MRMEASIVSSATRPAGNLRDDGTNGLPCLIQKSGLGQICDRAEMVIVQRESELRERLGHDKVNVGVEATRSTPSGNGTGNAGLPDANLAAGVT